MVSKSNQLTFSIDTSLLFQLGEQLVAKPALALAELVKNAYDADATEVVVTLKNVEDVGGTIIVKDDGHGMTLSEIKKSWMRIATTAKRDNPTSRLFCRPLTGAKGIGRFAARRLGQVLIINSVAQTKDGQKERIKVMFNWAKYFQPGADLDKIPVTYTQSTVDITHPTGVKLVIKKARDTWDKSQISELRRDLLTLQSPFPDLAIKPTPTINQDYPPDPGFNFILKVKGSEELENLSGGLRKEFLQAAWARLDGFIKDGQAHYKIHLYKMDETDQLIDQTNRYKKLEEARFRIFYFVYQSKYFEDFDFGVRDATAKGREEGGVRIYLDGFRVFPYGSKEDDWLRLNEYAAKNLDLAKGISLAEDIIQLGDKTEGRFYLLIPRNNQLFGAVAISQTKHRDIQVNVSRERLIAGDTEQKLRNFVNNGIYWLTVKYAATTAAEREKRRQEKKGRTVSEIIEQAQKTLADQENIPSDIRERVTQILSTAVKQAEVEQEEHISEIAMLRLLASAGTTLSLMNHQLRALIGSVVQIKADLKRLQSDIPDRIKPGYEDIVVQVGDWHQMVEAQVSQLGFLLGPDSRQRRKRHALYQIVENTHKPMTYYIKKYDIHFNNRVPKAMRTPPVYQAELYAILINLFSNALKAVYGQPEREVVVAAKKSDDCLYIQMMDTGIGLSPDRWEKSFSPFVTTSISNPILGVGTGLGLKVVRDILDLYGGTAHFIAPKPPWKTCIELILPERGT